MIMKINPEKLSIRKLAFFKKHGIEFKGNSEVIQVDEDNKTIHLGNGSTVKFDKLLVASGKRSRKLDIPGSDLQGVFSYRDFNDIDKIRSFIKENEVKDIVVVGGSFIGVEIAATLKSDFKESNLTLVNKHDTLF